MNHHRLNRKKLDDLLLFGVATISFLLAIQYDLFEVITGVVHRHEKWELDEFITLATVLTVCLLIYSFRRVRDLKQEIVRRMEVERKQEETVRNLKEALSEIKTLEGLIPICSNCKRIRDDQGYWQQVEKYISTKTDARFSHSVCPNCMKLLYPDIAAKLLSDQNKADSQD